MASFLQVILDSIQFLWPLRIVQQWERGGYYIFGRYWRDIGPGLYPVIPWFTEIRTLPIVPAIFNTPRLDITLRDGRTLSFSAAATVEVEDFDLANNSVDSYSETIIELVSAVLAEKLAWVDGERIEVEKRGRLMPDLIKWINEESMAFGVRTKKVRFTTFVLNIRTYRLLGESAGQPW